MKNQQTDQHINQNQSIDNSPEEIEARRQALKKRKSKMHSLRFLFWIGVIVLAAALGFGIFWLVAGSPGDLGNVVSDLKNKMPWMTESKPELDTPEPAPTPEPTPDPAEAALAQAETLAAGYDYEQAIAVLQQLPGYETNTQVTGKITEYEAVKSQLAAYPISEVTHVFFHTLINDCDKVFDGDSDASGYNLVMTTVDEFNKIMQQMYDRGFVLVELSDMAGYVTQADGTQVWTEKEILLPEGKKAFVLSQDDVSYYEYMEDDGYPKRLCIGEDGRITNEVVNDDGSVTYGSFDLVPLLEDFIAAHPDFSYKGARGYLALTGYDGILGYRTAEKYKESLGMEEWQRQVDGCKETVNQLLAQGWEFASHSWGHLNLGQVGWNTFVSDTTKWEDYVRPLLENNGTYKVDTIIYAFGNDIGSWTPYTTANEKFNYLTQCGFHYFCNVDSSRVWVQNNNELQYLRQGRRNLDGQRMWQCLSDPSKDLLSDLFDVKEVFDSRRPTPVE